MTLKNFLKYYDNMQELRIMEFDDNEDGKVLFSGYVFDKGAKKKLNKIYKQKYKLELNEDGNAVMVFPYVNEHGAKLAITQINVCR